MRKIFNVNTSKTGIGIEWSILSGGYAALAKWKFRILQRFATKGTASLGNEREFICRFEVGTDSEEQRISFLTFELWNKYEARFFLLIFKLWPGVNFTMAFNLGWRLTMSSRKFLRALAAGAYREAEIAQKKAQSGINIKQGGKIDPWLAQGRKLKAV